MSTGVPPTMRGWTRSGEGSAADPDGPETTNRPAIVARITRERRPDRRRARGWRSDRMTAMRDSSSSGEVDEDHRDVSAVKKW
jgi:hypothetical protein